MNRHVSVHHRELLPPELYPCTEPGCKFSVQGRGFGRKDHLKRHMSNVHTRLEP